MNVLPINMLVAVIVKPRPSPKAKKSSTSTKPVKNATRIAPTINRKYPFIRLRKKSFLTRSAPNVEPVNWAAKRTPARRSSRCQFTLRVGRIQPNMVVPTPVRANPTCNHAAGCARLPRSPGINDCAPTFFLSLSLNHHLSPLIAGYRCPSNKSKASESITTVTL